LQISDRQCFGTDRTHEHWANCEKAGWGFAVERESEVYQQPTGCKLCNHRRPKLDVRRSMIMPTPPSAGPALSEQYPRVQRFYARIMDSSNHSVRYQDDLWSFFQQCWHLKDWIKNDKGIPRLVREGIEKEVYRRRYIKICGDLANRGKAKMTRHISVHLYDTMGAPDQSRSSVVYSYPILRVSGSKIDALDLAAKAMCQWEAVLKKWKLIE
jgi:hypothetical protein